MSINTYSNSESESGNDATENTYCIFLHIVEGIGFYKRDGMGDIGEQRKSRILLKASLNGVKFEIEGHTLSTDSATIFNSNCIWECELTDIKRMKTDNRPVKLECFLKSGRSARAPLKAIGSLLLPIRGVQILNTLSYTTIKLHWHKLGALSSEWRTNKPEIYLVLMIVKKTILDDGQLESFLGKRKQYIVNPMATTLTTASTTPGTTTGRTCCDIILPNSTETSSMLQSQNNVYVQLLEQVGLIQVGNNPDIDCDIFTVTLTFKQVKHVAKLLEHQASSLPPSAITATTRTRISHIVPCDALNKTFSFHYDFLGSNSHVHLEIQTSDLYTINERVSITFKSSMPSLREYFQRIFYIPINLYYQNIAIANYRFDFTKFLPDDAYFNVQKLWTKNGTFYFDRLHKILSPHANKPSVDFIFTIQLITTYSKRNNCDILMPSVNDTYGLYKNDNKIMITPATTTQSQTSTQFDGYLMQLHRNMMPLSTRHIKTFDYYEKYPKAHSEPGVDMCNEHSVYARSFEGEMDMKESVNSEKDEIIFNRLQYYNDNINRNESDIDHKYNESNSIKLKSFSKGNDKVNESGNDNGRNIENVKKKTEIKVTVSSVNCQTEAEVKKSYETVAVNTDYMKELDQMELSLKIVQELEEWKCQQMEIFLKNLTQKEKQYMRELQDHWETQRRILQARLETKIAKCEQLNAQLEQAQIELSSSAAQNRVNLNLAEKIKRDIEKNYTEKFLKLDAEMQRLRLNLQERESVCEIKSKQMEVENARLEREKTDLKEQIGKLEKQLAYTHETHLSAEQLKELVTDLRKQSDRVMALETSRNYYKEQWSKAASEINKMKLACLKLQEQDLKSNKTNQAKCQEFDLCLEKILSEEQEDLERDKTKLCQIKGSIFSLTDVSSSSGDEGVFSNI